MLVDANRPKDSVERHKRTLESKRRWAKKHRAEAGGAGGRNPAAADEDEDGQVLGSEGGDVDEVFASGPSASAPVKVKGKIKPKPKAKVKSARTAPAMASPAKLVQPTYQAYDSSLELDYPPSPPAGGRQPSGWQRASLAQGLEHPRSSREIIALEQEREMARGYGYYAGGVQVRGRLAQEQEREQHFLHAQQLQQQYSHSHYQAPLHYPAYYQPPTDTRDSAPPLDYYSDPATVTSTVRHDTGLGYRRPPVQQPTQVEAGMPRSVSATQPPPMAPYDLPPPNLRASLGSAETRGATPRRESDKPLPSRGPESIGMGYSTSLPTFPSPGFPSTLPESYQRSRGETAAGEWGGSEILPLAAHASQSRLPLGGVAAESKADAAIVLMALKTGARSLAGGSSAPSSPGAFYAPPPAAPGQEEEKPRSLLLPAAGRGSKRSARDSPPALEEEVDTSDEEQVGVREPGSAELASPTKRARATAPSNLLDRALARKPARGVARALDAEEDGEEDKTPRRMSLRVRQTPGPRDASTDEEEEEDEEEYDGQGYDLGKNYVSPSIAYRKGGPPIPGRRGAPGPEHGEEEEEDDLDDYSEDDADQVQSQAQAQYQLQQLQRQQAYQRLAPHSTPGSRAQHNRHMISSSGGGHFIGQASRCRRRRRHRRETWATRDAFEMTISTTLCTCPRLHCNPTRRDPLLASPCCPQQPFRSGRRLRRAGVSAVPLHQRPTSSLAQLTRASANSWD